MSQQQTYSAQPFSYSSTTQPTGVNYGTNPTVGGSDNLAGYGHSATVNYGTTTNTQFGNTSSPVRSGTVGYGEPSQTSYTGYQPTTNYGTQPYLTTSQYTTGGPVTSNAYNDVWSGLRTSAIHEIKGNMESRGPNFGLDVRRHLDANVLNVNPSNRQSAIVDTLQRFNLVNPNRYQDPTKLWQNAPNPNPVLYQTPERNADTFKSTRVSQSFPGKLQNDPRQSVLSPYRNSSYPEFELVEDLPDRTHLIDSINMFLQKSPMRESLLTSPNRVSIQRRSVLSPAKIEVESLLKEKYEDGSVYEGEARDGIRSGKGKIIFKDGRVFEGDFISGRPQGNGTFYYKAGKVAYEGGVNDLLYEGQGVHYCEAPVPISGGFDPRDFNRLNTQWIRYEGEFKGGKRHGNGTLFLTNGERFQGEFKDDQIHGKGRFFGQTGQVVDGLWQNNLLI